MQCLSWAPENPAVRPALPSGGLSEGGFWGKQERVIVNAKKDVVQQETDLRLTLGKLWSTHHPAAQSHFGARVWFFSSPVTFSLLRSGLEAGLMVGGSLSDEDLPWILLCRRHRAGGHGSRMQWRAPGWDLSVEKHHFGQILMDSKCMAPCLLCPVSPAQQGPCLQPWTFTEVSMVSGTSHNLQLHASLMTWPSSTH